MVRLAVLATACIVAAARSAEGRGLLLNGPPWQRPTLADTSLSLEFGATAASGDTSAFLLGAALAPLRRGPLWLGFEWEFVSVRTADGRHFGFGDPEVAARLRLLGAPAGRAVLHVEGRARIPVADADLYPYANGGQEIELAGTLGLGQRAAASAGYIWSEPPKGGRLGTADVPHSLHVGLSLRQRLGGWVLGAHGDALWMETDTQRGQLEIALSRLTRETLHPTIALGFGIGPGSERVYDASIALRFATRLR